jgi:fructose-specific phosphotransferase system IIC component
MHLLLILALAVLYPAVHILNGWLFDFATINDHISLIYLPAFLRLFNLLVLGPIYGTLTTMLGGLLLLTKFEDPLLIGMFNILSSCASPIIALLSFRYFFKRRIQLTSLSDLCILTLVYCVANASVHQITWLLLDGTHVFDLQHAMSMFVGDLLGALLGAYLMKAVLDFLEKKGVKL